MAETPFMAAHGKAQECWVEAIVPLNGLPEFSAGLDWGYARNKYNALVKEFRTTDRLARAQTGTDNEEMSERDTAPGARGA
jgi:hypothetical protein